MPELGGELVEAVIRATRGIGDVLRTIPAERLQRLQNTTYSGTPLVRSVDDLTDGLWTKLTWSSRFTLIEREKRRRADVELSKRSIDPEIARAVPGAISTIDLWRRDRATRLGADGHDDLIVATGVLISAAHAWLDGRPAKQP